MLLLFFLATDDIIFVHRHCKTIACMFNKSNSTLSVFLLLLLCPATRDLKGDINGINEANTIFLKLYCADIIVTSKEMARQDSNYTCI